MADLNKTMVEIHKRFDRVKDDLKGLLTDYEDLFREVNRTYRDERVASGSAAGLEEFYRLLQVIRRNRDVIGSLVRGSNGLRPVDKFKFVEEDVPEEKIRKKKPPKGTAGSQVSPKDPTEPPPSLQDVEETEKIEELV